MLPPTRGNQWGAAWLWTSWLAVSHASTDAGSVGCLSVPGEAGSSSINRNLFWWETREDEEKHHLYLKVTCSNTMPSVFSLSPWCYRLARLQKHHGEREYTESGIHTQAGSSVNKPPAKPVKFTFNHSKSSSLGNSRNFCKFRYEVHATMGYTLR